jgi:hypothetical protein
MHAEPNVVQSGPMEHNQPAQGPRSLATVQAKPRNIWSKLKMTCPAGWREPAVRSYVETEFSCVGAKVYRSFVHQPPPGAAVCSPAVADVYLDFSMGRAKLSEAVKAMLAAPPRAVDDFIGGSVIIHFRPDDEGNDSAQSVQMPAFASADTFSPRAPNHQTLSPVLSWAAAAAGYNAQRTAGPLLATDNVLPVDAAAKASPRPVSAAVDSGNKIRMICPAGWREAAVRRYVETEFSCFDARVFRAYVHIPSFASRPSTPAVADVFLDFSMGRAKMGEAVKAMLAAPPRAVEDGVIVRFCADAATATGSQLVQVPASSSADSLLRPSGQRTVLSSIPPMATFLVSDGWLAQSGPSIQSGEGPLLATNAPLNMVAKGSSPAAADSSNKLRMTCPARGVRVQLRRRPGVPRLRPLAAARRCALLCSSG